MEKGEESELASSLAWLAQRVRLAWVSLSTSDLLDSSGYSDAPTTPLSTLTSHLRQHCPSYRVRQLGLTMRNSANIGQGLGYSGDSTAKVLTKFCTPNGSPKKFWPHTKKIL